MKRLLSAALMTVTLFAFPAFSYEGTLAIQENGSVKIEPLHRSCDESPQAAAMIDSCRPKTKRCPEGYERVAKYCWGGWQDGFYRCGDACRQRHDDCRWGGGDRSEICH